MKTTILRLLFALLLVSMLLTSQSIRPAYAASYVVNSLGDAVVNDSACTLREAILAANNAPANANCGAGSAGNDTITFSVSGTIPLSLNLPDIVSAATAGALTINGGGNITISSNYAGRVMVVNSGANLTLQNLTIANGNTSSFGGGFFHTATMKKSNSSYYANSAGSGGGCVYNT
ncbi:MAG: CSLREA domain-containing protein, partial [Caldilinea sp.]